MLLGWTRNRHPAPISEIQYAVTSRCLVNREEWQNERAATRYSPSRLRRRMILSLGTRSLSFPNSVSEVLRLRALKLTDFVSMTIQSTILIRGITSIEVHPSSISLHSYDVHSEDREHIPRSAKLQDQRNSAAKDIDESSYCTFVFQIIVTPKADLRNVCYEVSFELIVAFRPGLRNSLRFTSPLAFRWNLFLLDIIKDPMILFSNFY